MVGIKQSSERDFSAYHFEKTNERKIFDEQKIRNRFIKTIFQSKEKRGAMKTA